MPTAAEKGRAKNERAACLLQVQAHAALLLIVSHSVVRCARQSVYLEVVVFSQGNDIDGPWALGALFDVELDLLTLS